MFNNNDVTNPNHDLMNNIANKNQFIKQEIKQENCCQVCKLYMFLNIRQDFVLFLE